MELSDTVSSRSRLVSALASVVLVVVALRSLQRGKRLSGVVAGVSAVALGYNAAGRPRNPKVPLGDDRTSEEGELRCAICGEPIVAGEPREPNANDEIVHEACTGHPARRNGDSSIFSRVRKDVRQMV